MAGILRLDRPEEAIRAKWTVLLTAGVLLFLLGLTAAALPYLTSSLTVGVMSGLILLAAGVFLILTIIALKSWWTLVLTLLPFLAGLVLILTDARECYWPGKILGWLFLIQAPFRLMTGYRLRPALLWHWPAWAGLTPFLVGVMALAGWPSRETWAVGLLLGVDLVHSGLAWAGIALAGRADWD